MGEYEHHGYPSLNTTEEEALVADPKDVGALISSGLDTQKRRGENQGE